MLFRFAFRRGGFFSLRFFCWFVGFWVVESRVFFIVVAVVVGFVLGLGF